MTNNGGTDKTRATRNKDLHTLSHFSNSYMLINIYHKFQARYRHWLSQPKRVTLLYYFHDYGFGQSVTACSCCYLTAGLYAAFCRRKQNRLADPR
jgi:hypothetical protein